MSGISRRAFLRTVAIAGGAATVAPSLLIGDTATTLSPTPASSPPRKWVKLGKLTDFPVGQVTKVPVIGSPTKAVIFVSRPDDKTLKIFDSICPHRLCVINYDAGNKYFQCPCHRARFDRVGQVLRGPAPSGLTPIPTKMEKDVIWVDPNVPKPPLLDDEDD